MPVPQLKFLNAITGVPRKPVPLRYAILVADWDVGTVCALLSGELHYSGADDLAAKPLLTAYELTSGPSARRVSRGAVQDICSQIAPRCSRKTALKLIPRSFYVWSNELADAFQHYIELVPGRENARHWHLELNWDPALGNLRSLIEECPNPQESGSQRSRQATAVEQRNRRILAEYGRLKTASPHLSKSNIAGRIAQSGKFERVGRRARKNLAPEAIRRVINRFL